MKRQILIQQHYWSTWNSINGRLEVFLNTYYSDSKNPIESEFKKLLFLMMAMTRVAVKAVLANVNIFAKRSAENLKLTRSSLPEVFCEKVVLKDFSKFTGKSLCQSLRPGPASLLRKRLWHRCFPMNSPKF